MPATGDLMSWASDSFDSDDTEAALIVAYQLGQCLYSTTACLIESET